MSDKNEKTVITLKIELPKKFASGLTDIFWTRLELLIIAVFRLRQSKEDAFMPNVWRER